MNDTDAAGRRAAMAADRRFRAMGSDAHVIVVGDDAPALLETAIARIEQLESRWSRFRDTSEITALTWRAGEPVAVSADTTLLVERAIDAWRLSGGTFDPTVLGTVVRAGYHSTLTELDGRGGHSGLLALVGCTDIELGDGTVTLPAHTGFDPGGIGKGLAADLVVEELLVAGASGVCVNLGGDLRVEGQAPGGGTWTIAIEHPHHTEPLALVGLGGGAVATSTTLLRTWVADGEHRHHLIDPSTGAPADNGLALASVVTGAAWRAEVMAKTALLRGPGRAFDLFDGAFEGLVVTDDGAVHYSSGFEPFTSGSRPVRNTPV